MTRIFTLLVTLIASFSAYGQTQAGVYTGIWCAVDSAIGEKLVIDEYYNVKAYQSTPQGTDILSGAGYISIGASNHDLYFAIPGSDLYTDVFLDEAKITKNILGRRRLSLQYGDGIKAKYYEHGCRLR